MFQTILQFLTDFWVMVGALAAVFSAIVFAVAAVVGWFQLREAQELRKGQTRPFVVIEFRPEPSSIIFVRISNIGATMARAVQFLVEPALTTTRGAEWNVMELGIFKTGIKSLPPGRVIEFFFDTWIGRDNLPDHHAVTVTYKGDDEIEYEDQMDLDLGVYRNMRFVQRYGVHDIYKKLDEMASTLKDFKAWGGGVLALSPDDLAKRDEEMNEYVEQQRAQLENSQPSAPENGAERG